MLNRRTEVTQLWVEVDPMSRTYDRQVVNDVLEISQVVVVLKRFDRLFGTWAVSVDHVTDLNINQRQRVDLFVKNDVVYLRG